MPQFELPDGWEWRTLGDVASISAGTTAPQEEKYFVEGRYPFVRAKDVGRCGRTANLVATADWVNDLAINKKRLKHARKGAILFPKSGASILTGSRAKLGVEAYVVSHLAIADGDPTIVDDSWLFHWLCTADMVALAQSESGYPSLRLSDVQTLEIPVPPIPEQKRLVARIEAQTSRVEAVRKAQHELVHEMHSVLVGFYAEITAAAEWKPLSEVAPQARRPVTVQAGQSYPELGIRSFGKGTFHKPAISAEQLGSKRLYHIHPGDLIFNNVFAWEGAVAVVKPEDVGRVGSHRFITCVPKPGVTTTPFLYFHFTTEQGLHDLGDASPGGAGRNRTLGLKNLAAIRVPVPSHGKQVVFTRLWNKIETTRRLQAELKADLAAYVPSVLAKAFRGEL